MQELCKFLDFLLQFLEVIRLGWCWRYCRVRCNCHLQGCRFCWC